MRKNFVALNYQNFSADFMMEIKDVLDEREVRHEDKVDTLTQRTLIVYASNKKVKEIAQETWKRIEWTDGYMIRVRKVYEENVFVPKSKAESHEEACRVAVERVSRSGRRGLGDTRYFVKDPLDDAYKSGEEVFV